MKHFPMTKPVRPLVGRLVGLSWFPKRAGSFTCIDPIGPIVINNLLYRSHFIELKIYVCMETILRLVGSPDSEEQPRCMSECTGKCFLKSICIRQINIHTLQIIRYNKNMDNNIYIKGFCAVFQYISCFCTNLKACWLGDA